MTFATPDMINGYLAYCEATRALPCVKANCNAYLRTLSLFATEQEHVVNSAAKNLLTAVTKELQARSGNAEEGASLGGMASSASH